MAAPGEMLRRARQDAGLSQAQLAARLHCAQSSVCQTEQGRRKMSVDLVCRYAAAMGLELQMALVPREDSV